MKKIFIVACKRDELQIDPCELIAGLSQKWWQDMFLPDDINIETQTVDNNYFVSECCRLSFFLHLQKPDATLIFETIPHRTQITIQGAVYNRDPMEREKMEILLDDEKRVIKCTLDTDTIIRTLAKKEIPAIYAQDLRPADCSYISSFVATHVKTHRSSMRFGLIQLPLLSAEVCRNIHHRYAPSISRQTLIDAIHIICQFA